MAWMASIVPDGPPAALLCRRAWHGSSHGQPHGTCVPCLRSVHFAVHAVLHFSGVALGFAERLCFLGRAGPLDPPGGGAAGARGHGSFVGRGSSAVQQACRWLPRERSHRQPSVLVRTRRHRPPVASLVFLPLWTPRPAITAGVAPAQQILVKEERAGRHVCNDSGGRVTC